MSLPGWPCAEFTERSTYLPDSTVPPSISAMTTNGTVKMETTERVVTSAAKHQFGGVHFADTDVYLKGLMPAKHLAGEKDPSVDPIKSIEHFRIRPRWLFVRVETEKGIVGWGEATLEGEMTVQAGSGRAPGPRSEAL